MIQRFLVLVLSILAGLIPAAAAPTLVIDAETGAVIHADRAGVPWYPASLTKLMTAYVTFERLRDDPGFTLDTELKVSARANKEPPSKMGVQPGSTVTVERAIDAMIIYSANDIAWVLAEGVAGNVGAFVERMNRTAARLGMDATHFRNPNGLPDAGQITTARDLAILTRALIADFPEYAAVFADPVLEWGKRKLNARNSLLRTYDGADGMKTGFICASGYNVIATATRGGRRLIAVVLGAANGNFRMQMAGHLLDAAFARGGAPSIEYGAVETLSNEASRLVAPPDLRPQICEKSEDRPQIVKSGPLEGWGVMLGLYDNAKSANSTLAGSLAVLRGIVSHGKAMVVNGAATGGHAAVLAGLTIDEALEVCDHLGKAGVACALLTPGEVNNPPSTWN